MEQANDNSYRCAGGFPKARRSHPRINVSRRAPHNQPSGTTTLPCQGPGYVQMNHGLGGRMEKRLPIAIVVRLSRMRQSPAKEETTYTDNVSPQGARIFSTSCWLSGEQAQVTTVKEGCSMCGEVIYCQRLDSGRICIGLKFQERPVKWPILSRYYRM